MVSPNALVTLGKLGHRQRTGGRTKRRLEMEKILIADDHPLVRGALALAVEAAFGRAEILESASLHELVGQLEKIGVADLVLLDLRMPGKDALQVVIELIWSFRPSSCNIHEIAPIANEGDHCSDCGRSSGRSGRVGSNF